MLSRFASMTALGAARGSQITPSLTNVAARLYHEKVRLYLLIYSQLQELEI